MITDEMSDKTFAQEMREENDRLSFKMRANAMRGKTFTMEQCRELCATRENELQRLRGVK